MVTSHAVSAAERRRVAGATPPLPIICFGQQNWDRTWTEKQQHCVGLARRGHRVLYVDPDAVERTGSLCEGLRALVPVALRAGLRTIEPGLFVHGYRHAPILRWRLNTWRRPRVLRRLSRSLGFESPVVLAFHPHANHLIDALAPRAIFYYAVDEMSAFGGMMAADRARVRAAEEALLVRSRAAFGVSPRLVERFARIQPNSVLLENGVDPEHFAPDRLATLAGVPEVTRLPAPRLGLIGQVDERVDQALLLALASAHPEWSIVIVGRVKEGVDVSALRARRNIHLLGFRPYDELPRVLRDLDACLVPYHRTLLTDSCNPSKIYEYVAAGKPVIATPLDGIVACRPVVTLADSPAAFVAAAEDALRDPAAGLAERLRIAGESRWEHRTDVLEDVMLRALQEDA